MAILASCTTNIAWVSTCGGVATGDETWAQRFTLSSPANITDFSMNFNANTGSPTGNMVVTIETQGAGTYPTGGFPSGTLAHANLTKTFVPTASQWNDITFASFGNVIAGSYWLTVKVDDQANNTSWNWYRDSVASAGMAYSTDFGVNWSNYGSGSYSHTYKISGDFISSYASQIILIGE